MPNRTITVPILPIPDVPNASGILFTGDMIKDAIDIYMNLPAQFRQTMACNHWHTESSDRLGGGAGLDTWMIHWSNGSTMEMVYANGCEPEL